MRQVSLPLDPYRLREHLPASGSKLYASPLVPVKGDEDWKEVRSHFPMHWFGVVEIYKILFARLIRNQLGLVLDLPRTMNVNLCPAHITSQLIEHQPLSYARRRQLLVGFLVAKMRSGDTQLMTEGCTGVWELAINRYECNFEDERHLTLLLVIG
jgi:hypothetical protein